MHLRMSTIFVNNVVAQSISDKIMGLLDASPHVKLTNIGVKIEALLLQLSAARILKRYRFITRIYLRPLTASSASLTLDMFRLLLLSTSPLMTTYSPGVNPCLLVQRLADTGPLRHHRQHSVFTPLFLPGC